MKWRSLDETAPGADIRPLREILTERKALISRYVPEQTQAIHARVISELRQQGIAQRALGIGAKAPGFELKAHDGKLTRSADLLTKGSLVICFFRGRWCPFCVGQLEAMNLVLPEIHKSGALLVAVSPQTVQQSFFMADQHKLRFPLLSDAGNQVARRFGLAYRVPDDQRDIYKRTFVNLPFTNGDDSWELPVPATYILNTDGTIRFASINPDYTERPEPVEILDRLRSQESVASSQENH